MFAGEGGGEEGEVGGGEVKGKFWQGTSGPLQHLYDSSELCLTHVYDNEAVTDHR